MAALYSEAELSRAVALREHGMTWPEIGSRLNRPYEALCNTANLYRKGGWAPRRRYARSRQIEADIEAAVSEGLVRLTDIARRVGLTPQATGMRLLRMGLDTEMRRELAPPPSGRTPA